MDKIDFRNREGELDKLLIFYCKEGDFEMAELLIDSGANVNAIGKDDWDIKTALMLASEKRHLEIVKLLIDSGSDDLNNALWYALKNGRLKVAEFLKSKGAI